MVKLTENWAPLNWDEAWYLRRNPDVADALAQGRLTSPLMHFLQRGLAEGRYPSANAEREAQLTRPTDDDSRSTSTMIGTSRIPLDWPVRGEIAKTFKLRLANGFFGKYLSGSSILEIGFKGGNSAAVPIFPHAVGVDLDFPNYDGITLPVDNSTVDSVFSSHVLEHVPAPAAVIRDWFRVIKIGGFIVCIVPHQHLYERRRNLPSAWSNEHLRFYTPGSLLYEFERALRPNSYRVRHLADNDLAYNYTLNDDVHPTGCYEIELVIEKIEPPSWEIA